MKAVRVAIIPSILLLLAPACGKGSAGSASSVDTTAVRTEVDSVMRRHFAAFEKGDLATWTGMLDQAVFFSGGDPADVFSGRDSVLAGMQQDFGPAFSMGLTISIRPLSNTIWAAPDGQAAGATYDLDYTVTIADRTLPYHLRAAYFLKRDTTGWQALAAQYSRPIEYDSLFLALMSRRVPGAARVGGEVPSAAGEIVRQFRSDIKDIARASIAPEASVVTPGSIVRGETAREDLARWLGPAGNATEPGDGIRAGLSPGGTAGWVATNLHVPVFAGPESAIAPLRALFIYRLGKDRWEIIQASLSVGLRDQS